MRKIPCLLVFFVLPAAGAVWGQSPETQQLREGNSGELLTAPDPSEMGKQALRLLIKELNNPDPDIVVLAARAFGEVGNPSVKRLLGEKLKARDGFVRVAAAAALGRLEDYSGVPVLRAIIGKVPVPGGKKSPLQEMRAIAATKLREKAVRALAEIQGSKAVEFLAGLNRDPYGGVRDAAAVELARLGYDEDASQFIDALGSGDEGVRLAGATALSRICAAYSLDAVKKAMRAEKSAGVKQALLETMACVGDIVSMPEILAATEDSSNIVRLKAVLALSGINNPAALSRIRAIYEAGNDIYLRVAAMKSLVAAGEKINFDLLDQAMSMTDPALKTQALSVIEKTSGVRTLRILDSCLVDSVPAVQIKAASQILVRLQKEERLAR